VILGIQNTAPYPIDLAGSGMPSCLLYQSPDVLLPTLFTAGNSRVSLPIPSDRSLWGSVFFTQGVALDRSANVAGVSLSNGGSVEIRG
jgi:hypothetical protein